MYTSDEMRCEGYVTKKNHNCFYLTDLCKCRCSYLIFYLITLIFVQCNSLSMKIFKSISNTSWLNQTKIAK